MCLQRRLASLFVLLFSIGCGGTEDAGLEPDASPAADASVADSSVSTEDLVTVERLFDEPSQTYYFLTRIPHTDHEGTLLKLEHAQALLTNGETVPQFAARMGNPRVAINASMGELGLPDGIRVPVGTQIVDGVIIQELSKPNRFTLGIKDDNELVAYPAGTTGQAMLDDGSSDALTAFVPLIIDHEPAPEEVLEITAGLTEAHPRQVIAQFDNLDLLILSCGGRGIDGLGMNSADLVRILEAHEDDVKFAFNLDGGGSVSTVVDGELITPQIDGDGTMDRPRPNFLYVE